MLEACLPFGPWVTSKVTRWPSFRVLKPAMLIAEKCANRSSPPSSGVIKPKPLESLNHLTVPVANASLHTLQIYRADALAGACRIVANPADLPATTVFASRPHWLYQSCRTLEFKHQAAFYAVCRRPSSTFSAQQLRFQLSCNNKRRS